MNLKKVKLLYRTPRDLKAVKKQINIRKGLGVYFFFATLMFLFAIVLVLTAVFFKDQPYEVRVYQGLFGPLFLGAFGLSFYMPARKRLKTRINCLTNGNLVTAMVVDHGRVFVPYKSFRDYSVEAVYTTESGKKVRGIIQRSNPKFQKYFPVGSEIQALYDPKSKSLFLPAEIGVDIVEY